MELTLASAKSPRVRRGSTLLVPVGATAQHGPHLPLDTDTEIAVHVAEHAAKLLRRRRLSVIVAPAIAFGSSGEHQAFPGTVSIGTNVLSSVLVEVGRSALTWAERVLFVNAGGGNEAALHVATARLAEEGRDVSWVAACPTDGSDGSDGHAGRAETSLMLHLRPWDVRMAHAHSRLAAGRTADDDPSPAPADASAGEGLELFEELAWNVVNAVLMPARSVPMGAPPRSPRVTDVPYVLEQRRHGARGPSVRRQDRDDRCVATGTA